MKLINNIVYPFRAPPQARRMSLNWRDLMNRAGVKPTTLFDFGANKSQFARWVVRHNPGIRTVHSFEPNPYVDPRFGCVHRYALSDESHDGLFTPDGTSSSLGGPGGLTVPVRRFDSLGLGVPKCSILKVDCESHTLQALRGCGELLSRFDSVMVEVVNTHDSQFHHNLMVETYQLMHDAGFGYCEVCHVGTGLLFPNIGHLDVAWVHDAPEAV